MWNFLVSGLLSDLVINFCVYLPTDGRTKGNVNVWVPKNSIPTDFADHLSFHKKGRVLYNKQSLILAMAEVEKQDGYAVLITECALQLGYESVHSPVT